MNRRSFFVFAAVFMMILMAFSPALAADEMVYIDGDSQKVIIDEEALSSEWTTLPEGNFEAPTISIRVLDRSKLGVENGEYIIPVTVKLEKPDAIANMEAKPYLRKVRIVNGKEDGYDELLIGSSFVYNIYAPDNILDEGFVDFFTIRWKNSSDEILMREVLQYIVSTEGYTDPFDEVSRPDIKNRIKVILDEKLVEGSKPAVTYAFDEKGDLTFTVHEISKEIVKALYTPGMNCILGDAEITAPGGCTQLWEVTGNITYEAFVNGYTTGTYRENQARFSNGRELWKIDENDDGITVIPMEYSSCYYLCWQDDNGNKHPEMLKITVKMADDAKVVTISEEELDPVTNVPASRISHGGSGQMKQRANQAGAEFSYDEQAGIALFEMKKSPEEVISLAEENKWDAIPLDIWVKVPEGCKASGTYTIDGWTGKINIKDQDGVKYAEIGRGVYDSRDGIVTQDVNVILQWNKTDGGIMLEKFRFKSTFPGRTWMDKYWTPAPETLLAVSLDVAAMREMGFNVDITPGKVHCSFNDGAFPTIEQVYQLMNTRLILSENLPAGTAKVKRNASSGGTSTDYNIRISNDQKEIVNNSGFMEAQGLFMGNICPLAKRSVGDMNIDYYCAITENNLVVLTQFYNQNDTLIQVGEEGKEKDGYYFVLEVEPFHYAVSSSVVDDISKADKENGIVKKPTLVLPELGNNAFTFTAQLFPQQINSSDKNPNIKYYLRLETDVPPAMLEDGVDVYIPYSMIHPALTYEKALDDKKFKVAHLYDDDRHKENLTGEPTEYGMKFVVNSFSPFVIEVEEEEQSGNNTPGNTGSSGGGSSGISVTYNGGNSFSTSKSAVPTSVEIDGVPVSFTGDGRSFTVSSIPAGAKWITVRWNSTSITVSFKPDANMVYADVAIPKTGDASILMPVLMLMGIAAIQRRK